MQYWADKEAQSAATLSTARQTGRPQAAGTPSGCKLVDGGKSTLLSVQGDAYYGERVSRPPAPCPCPHSPPHTHHTHPPPAPLLDSLPTPSRPSPPPPAGVPNGSSTPGFGSSRYLKIFTVGHDSAKKNNERVGDITLLCASGTEVKVNVKVSGGGGGSQGVSGERQEVEEV